jgi:tRNA acetyltransferase TAN1
VILGEQVETLVPGLASAFSNPSEVRSTKVEVSGGNTEAHESAESVNPATVEPSPIVTGVASNISDALASELSALRQPQEHVFTRVDWGMQGSVFLKVTDCAIPVDTIVESVLRNARKNKTPSSRNCVRFIPVHSTCYAKPEDAAHATAKVVKNEFPNGKHSYSIVYRSRMNTDAHREDFIKAIAASIEETVPDRFKVNLERPEFVVIVEVVRTTCCVGIFKHYYELARLNIREVSKPDEVGRLRKPAAVVNEITETADARSPGFDAGEVVHEHDVQGAAHGEQTETQENGEAKRTREVSKPPEVGRLPKPTPSGNGTRETADARSRDCDAGEVAHEQDFQDPVLGAQAAIPENEAAKQDKGASETTYPV